MTAKYSPVTINVGSWRLRTQRPKVLLAQIPATYEPGEQTDRRMRHVHSPAYADRLISIINAQVDYDADFLVFPEYAWPVWAIDASVAALREHLVEGTLAILPLEHLPLGEVASVLSRFPIEASRRAAVVSELEAAAVPAQRARTIVNLCVIVIRAGGELVAFPQPKLMPAALEEHPASGWYFAPSHSLYVLAGKDVHDNAFRIATLICFDFLAKDRGQLARVRDAVLAGAPHVVFVPECNPAPMHPLYARAIAGILEDARLESPPFVAFANVARGTHLPGYDKECFFGFSRVAGELGACSPSLAYGYIVRSGIFAHDSPRQLADLAQPPQEIEAPDIKWAIARPQESLLSSTLPLDGIDSDPTGGRLHCEISISRGLPQNVWKLIRTSVALTPPPEPPHRVPPDLVPKTGLVGSADATRQLSEALDRSPKPIWIVGSGGIGKSALIANFAGLECSDVVWIDMEQVGPREGALLEALLTALGRTLALAQSEDEQWKTVREAIRAKPTLVVLDSFEKAELASVPAPLLNALGWKARLIVTSRALLVDASEVEKVEVPLLTTADSKLLLRATCEGAITDAQLERASQLANGSPLACLWLATLIKAGLFPADAEAAALSELQQIFARTTHDLTVVDKSVLAACCQLPAAVRIEDLAAMVSMDPAAIMVSARRLQDRALCSLENGTLRPRHPFVRQFTRDPGIAPDVFPKCLAWVAGELGRHGGDRNWDGYTRLDRVWPNVRHILLRLYDGTPEEKREFLRLWRQVDYFLWGRARWRERIEMGHRALSVARQLDDDQSAAHALHDAIGETGFHLNNNADEALAAYDAAAAIYEKLGSARGRAWVEYYRSRVLRKAKRNNAMASAQRAESLAREAGDQQVLAMVLNSQANILRGSDPGEALTQYGLAYELFAEEGDKEMLAIVNRNRGRALIALGKYANALEYIEEAIARLHGLGLPMEEAECVLYHAHALAGIGDCEEAFVELDQVDRFFTAIGSGLRAGDLRDARKEVARICTSS